MYKISKDAKIWERNMFQRCKEIEGKAPYDVYHLYIELENVSKPYLENGEMEEGDSYVIPMKDGSSFTFSFNKKTTAILMKNNDGTEREMLLHRDGPKKEKEVLLWISDAYKNGGWGIGEKYPEELKQLLEEIQIGDIVNFSDKGKMYVCSSITIDGKSKTLQELRMKQFTGNIEDFKSFNAVGVNLSSEHSIQQFYDSVKNLMNSRTECRVFCDDSAKGWVSHIALTTKEEESISIDLAGIQLLVQKQHDKSLKWYDNRGNQVDETTVKLIYSYLKTAPVERKIICKDTPDYLFKNTLFYNELEALYSESEFQKALNLIALECKNRNGFVYHEKSVIQESDVKFTPKTFAFYIKDGEFKICTIEYEDNDFTKAVKSVKESSPEKFIEFCEQKYNELYHLILSRSEAELRKDYPKEHNEDENTVFFDFYNSKISEEKFIKTIKDNPPISSSDFEELGNELAILLQETDYETDSIQEVIEGLEL